VTKLVVSSSALPFDVAGFLGDRVRYVAPREGRLDRAALLAAVADADALIAVLRDRIDGELLAAAPRLRVVANCAVGFDNVDLAAAAARRLPVTNTPGVLTDATADFAFALLLAAARRVVEGDALARSGRWTGWEPTQLLGAEVAGRTLGIVGMGRIGRAVARRARGFSMSIVYAARSDVPEEAAQGAQHVPVDELLGVADFVSLHCPLTPETAHLIDAAALRRMKRTAILINTARGGCVDEAALAAALRSGAIAGAGLDVFEREPLIHADLRAAPGVVLAPHAGSATTSTRARMAEICARAVRDALAGRRPATVVNPEALA
jgi:glyoxylate reductase